MKKTYLQPQVEIMYFEPSHLLQASAGWSQDNGDVITVDPDPSDDDEFLDLD